MCRWSILAVRAWSDNCEQPWFPAAKLGLESLDTEQENGEHIYFYQLNGKKLLVGFISTISEGMQLHSQI
jgi:hypothetical protein